MYFFLLLLHIGLEGVYVTLDAHISTRPVNVNTCHTVTRVRISNLLYKSGDSLQCIPQL